MRITRRGRLWPVLGKLPSMFPNVNRAVKWIQGQGLGYHYQTMWRDVRSAFDTAEKTPLQQAFGRYDYLPQELFIEKDWKRPESYYYYGTVTFWDPVTKQPFDRDYSIYADTSLTDRELEELVWAAESEKVDEYGIGWEVVAFTSLRRFHKWGAPRSEGYRVAEI